MLDLYGPVDWRKVQMDGMPALLVILQPMECRLSALERELVSGRCPIGGASVPECQPQPDSSVGRAS